MGPNSFAPIRPQGLSATPLLLTVAPAYGCDVPRLRGDRAEAMLDGSEHQITNVLAADAAGGGEETHGFAITAIEREGDPHPFTVVAANLKAVGAPAAVSPLDRAASLLAPPHPPRPASHHEALGPPHPA